MRYKAWDEKRDQGPIHCGDQFMVANKGDTVIVIIARKGEKVFYLLDELERREAETGGE